MTALWTNTPLWTALVTPFHEGGAIHWDNWTSLIEAQCQARNGLVLFGSTGEGMSLTMEEKQALVVRALAIVKNRVPIMVNVPSVRMQESIDWVEWCNTQPIDALLIPTPAYSKPGVQGQIGWFDTLLSRTRTPVMLYHIPGRSGIALHHATLDHLIPRYPTLAIKDSGGNPSYFANYSLPLFCGDDGLLLEFRDCGAVGLISVIGNAWPQAVHRAINHTDSMNKNTWRALCRCLEWGTNPLAIKHVLALKGLITSPFARLPLHSSDALAGDISAFDAEARTLTR